MEKFFELASLRVKYGKDRSKGGRKFQSLVILVKQACWCKLVGARREVSLENEEERVEGGQRGGSSKYCHSSIFYE